MHLRQRLNKTFLTANMLAFADAWNRHDADALMSLMTQERLAAIWSMR